MFSRKRRPPRIESKTDDMSGHTTEPKWAHVAGSLLDLSGWLAAERNTDIIELDFPSRPPAPCLAPDELLRGLGHKPQQVLKSRDFVAVYGSQKDVAALTPDMELLEKVNSLGVIATAPGDDCDFVSRFFAPRAGVPEDPVT